MTIPKFSSPKAPLFTLILALLLSSLSCANTQRIKREEEPVERPPRKSLDSLSRLLFTLHGNTRKDDALAKSCQEAWSSIDRDKRARLWILDDPSPIALIHSDQAFLSRGLIGLIGRRSLAVDRQPFEPGRALIALMAHMQAHLELHGQDGLLKVAADCSLEKEREQALKEGRLKVRKVSRLARSIRAYRRDTWPSKLCREADARALKILESQSIPGESLVEAYRALVPEEKLFGSDGASSIFKDRHPISSGELQALQESLKARPTGLSGKQVARGRKLGALAQNEGKKVGLARLWQRSRVYERRGLEKEALDKTKAGLKRSPKNPSLLSRLGRLSMALKREEEGEIYLRRALSVDPEHVPARVELAKLFLSRGWLEAAETDLRVAAELCPLYGPLYTVKAELERKKKSEAWSDFQAIGLALGHPFSK